jgi:hypothetical protein
MLLRDKYTVSREEAFENDSWYAFGTYVIRVSGRDAVKATPLQILRWLDKVLQDFQQHDTRSLYREKEAGKWFLVLTAAAVEKHKEQLRDLVKDVPGEEISITIVPVEKDRIKGCIKWVPFGFRHKCLEGIVKKMTGDDKTVLTRDEPRNLWFFQFSPGLKEIPHYLDLEVAGESNSKQALVYLPGRKTACLMCGEDTHWENKCPKWEIKRNQKQRNNETADKGRQPLTSPTKNGKVSHEKSKKGTDKPREGSPLPKATSEKGARPMSGNISYPLTNNGKRKKRRETKIKSREPETPLTESESDADSLADTGDESAQRITQDALGISEGVLGLISACIPETERKQQETKTHGTELAVYTPSDPMEQTCTANEKCNKRAHSDDDSPDNQCTSRLTKDSRFPDGEEQAVPTSDSTTTERLNMALVYGENLAPKLVSPPMTPYKNGVDETTSSH